MGEEKVEKGALNPPMPPDGAKAEEEVKEEVKKEEVKVKKFEVGTLATQTEPVILFGEEQYNIHEALALVLNKLLEIEKAVL